MQQLVLRDIWHLVCTTYRSCANKPNYLVQTEPERSSSATLKPQTFLSRYKHKATFEMTKVLHASHHCTEDDKVLCRGRRICLHGLKVREFTQSRTPVLSPNPTSITSKSSAEEYEWCSLMRSLRFITEHQHYIHKSPKIKSLPERAELRRRKSVLPYRRFQSRLEAFAAAWRNWSLNRIKDLSYLHLFLFVFLWCSQPSGGSFHVLLFLQHRGRAVRG